MKIGILTWYYGINYGAKLHSYALQNIISDLGYENEFINFCPIKSLYRDYRCGIPLKQPSKIIKGIKHNYAIQKFMKKFIVGPRVRNAEDIDALGYNLISIGSDEILKVNHPLSNLIYYGVGIKTKKMIFAASAGQTDCNYELDSRIKNSFNEMYKIYVRGYNTKLLVENNSNKTAEVVPDPTLMYDFNEFNDEFPEDNYILIYAFYDLDEIKYELIEYAKRNNLQLISILKEYSWADKNYTDLSVELWLASYKKAKLVVTDSFHAVCFSLKNSRQIIPIGSASKITKISDLLNLVGMNRPFYKKGETIEGYLCENEVDYDTVETRLEDLKKKSLAVLEAALKGI